MKTIPKKCLLFSDLHLGVHQNSPRWHQLAVDWSVWVKQTAEKENAEAIVCLGDYFHDRDQIDVSTLDVARKILNSFSDFKVYLITGNHDIYYKEKNDVTSLHVFKDYPYVTVVNETVRLKYQDKQINMVPWTDATDANNFEGDVVLTHAEFKNFRMNNSKFCESGFELEKYAERERMILAGHFHISDVRKMGKLTGGYLGNPFQHTFADINNNKYLYILDLETMELKKIENEFSPRHEIIRYSKKEEPKRKNSIVRLIYDVSDTPEKYTSFASFIQENHKPFTLLTQTDFELKADLEQVETNVSFESMLEQFVNSMEIENKKETSDYCLNLYKRCT